MLSQDLRPCPFCRTPAEHMIPGGGTFGGSLSDQWFHCPTCGAPILLVFHAGGNLLTFFRKNQMERREGETENHMVPKVWHEWLNKVVLPTWRDREDRIKRHKDQEFQEWLAEVFYPKFPDLKGFIPEEYAKHGAASPFTDKSISYHDCPSEAQALYDAQFAGGMKATSTYPRYGTYLPLPEDLTRPQFPPKAPDGYTMYVRMGDEWVWVDPSATAEMPVPEDPILRHNREFFTDVWSRVEAALWMPLPARQEARNEYGGLEPWYTFTLADVAFTVGWRKRVVSIQVESPTRPLPTKDIKALADRDNVTYEAFGEPHLMTVADLEALLQKDGKLDTAASTYLLDQFREQHPEGKMVRDGGWKADLPEATGIVIHAWGKDKTVEYLVTLCQTVLASAPVDYAAIEARILAAEGKDVHEELARTMFQKGKKDLTPSEAQLHRAASFGILYGRSYGPPGSDSSGPA